MKDKENQNYSVPRKLVEKESYTSMKTNPPWCINCISKSDILTVASICLNEKHMKGIQEIPGVIKQN